MDIYWVLALRVRRVQEYDLLEEVELSDEFAWRHMHVVAKPTGDHRVVHDGLVGLVLEVAVPATPELWAGPAVHLCEFLFGGANFDASLDTVGGKRTSAVDVPLIEDFLLNCWIAANKVVKGLRIWFSAISREGKVVVCYSQQVGSLSMRLAALLPLKIKTHARQIHDSFYTDIFELLWITNTAALEDQGRAQRSTTDNNLLANLDDCAVVLVRREGLGGNHTNTNCTSVLDDHLVNLCVAHQMQVLVYRSRAVDVRVGTWSNVSDSVYS